MNEDKIMDKINKNLKIIDNLLMGNGFYKYISKVVNIEDGTSQLYDNLKHLQQENEELKKQIENKYKKVGTLTNEILYEENTKLQQENARLKDKLNKINDLLNEPIFEYDNIPCNIENEIIQLKDILKEKITIRK